MTAPIPDKHFVRVIKNHSPEPLTTKEVAELVHYSSRGAYNRLERLAEDGKIGRKESGQWTVWYKLPSEVTK